MSYTNDEYTKVLIPIEQKLKNYLRTENLKSQSEPCSESFAKLITIIMLIKLKLNHFSVFRKLKFIRWLF